MDPQYEWIQKTLLEEEGVQFDARGRVPLPEYRWQPGGDDGADLGDE